MNEKKSALLKFFNIDTLDKNNVFVANVFTFYCSTYLVLTDEEANNEMYEYVKNNMCVFDAEFILEQSDIKYTEETKTSLTKMLNSCTNDCNSFILAFIESTCGIDYFVESAIKHNGRTFFISFFDNLELHIDEDLFAYQLN